MRVKKYLPSLITLTNLFLGFLSILYIQKGDEESLIIGCYLIYGYIYTKFAHKCGLHISFP